MAIEIQQKENSMKLTVIDNLGEIKILRKVVEYWLEENDVDDFQIMAIKLCVHEAVNNSMIHAYEKGHVDKTIAVVNVSLTANDIQISVSDQGNKDWYHDYISRLNDEEKEMHSTNPRGRGLIIIRKLVDALSVENGENNGTKIVMKINRSGKDNIFL